MKPRKAVYLLVGSPALKRAKECLTRNQPRDYEAKLMKIVSLGQRMRNDDGKPCHRVLIESYF
ncbi:hypothetical protein [Vibrio sp. Vb2658]|uniref:hypothetical protein n=1 Tax=Vibrio sp. Vb2658 TaxID=3074672 RepID=UPI002965501C|nr:hypothetical protein [Vibrio sp. Vb2658]MDW1660109.1 hypothetical protein [Vibrio sp. Vb2658]